MQPWSRCISVSMACQYVPSDPKGLIIAPVLYPSSPACTLPVPPPAPLNHTLHQKHTTPWILSRSPSLVLPPTYPTVFPSHHPPPALPLTIKKYLYNFKWHLSAVWRKGKQGKEKSSEGVFSTLLFSHPSYCQTLKSVSLTSFSFTFFISSEWLAGTHFDSLTRTRNFTSLPVPFACMMGINPCQRGGCHPSGCFWVSNMLHLISFLT